MKTQQETLSEMQERINRISAQFCDLQFNVDRAKQSLNYLVEHWDERSPSALRNEIIAIIEEQL